MDQLRAQISGHSGGIRREICPHRLPHFLHSGANLLVKAPFPSRGIKFYVKVMNLTHYLKLLDHERKIKHVVYYCKCRPDLARRMRIE